jgi:hypothetical protein
MTRPFPAGICEWCSHTYHFYSSNELNLYINKLSNLSSLSVAESRKCPVMGMICRLENFPPSSGLFRLEYFPWTDYHKHSFLISFPFNFKHHATSPVVEIIAPNFCQKNGGKRIPLAVMRSRYSKYFIFFPAIREKGRNRYSAIQQSRLKVVHLCWCF